MSAALGQSDIINMDSLAVPAFELEHHGWGVVPPRESWRVERKFRQTDIGAKKSTLFKRFNRRYLSVQVHRRKKELPEQVVDLSFVTAEPKEVKNYQYKLWLLAACLLTIPVAFSSMLPVEPLWLFAPAALAILPMVMALRMKTHYYAFQALNSDVTLFTVDASLPGKAEAEAFVGQLSASIANAQNQLPAGKQRVPLAVAEMRRLSETGVISKAQYEAIKANWFQS